MPMSLQEKSSRSNVQSKKKKEKKIILFLKRTFAMIKPDAYTKMGKIIEAIEKHGFVISNLKMVKLSLRDAQEFYAEHQVFKGKYLNF